MGAVSAAIRLSSGECRRKAMPVILTTPAEFDQWLEADTIGALAPPEAVA
jgi:hypothetical protein